MSWKDRWPEREARPKVKRLSKTEKAQILAVLSEGITASPVLTALDFRARSLRGRFYFERLWDDDEEAEIETVSRATPLDGFEDALLLEVEKSTGNWYRVMSGTAEQVVECIAGDGKGTFHGLGALDANLRRAGALDRLDVGMHADFRFVYTKTGAKCTVQEALFHFFGVPIEVIAEPREWYVYHRRPEIVEVNQDQSGVLVEFSAMSMSGSFGGTCLYAIVDGHWQAFTIKPNQSQNIATALTWLEKREWQDW